MLLRIILVADSASHQKRLRKLLAQPDIVIDTVRGRNRLWERISCRSCDLLVVSESVIPEPVLGTVTLFAELPDSPGIVVVTDQEAAERRAGLIAAGCDAVLNLALPDSALEEMLSTILAKRLDAAERDLAVRPALSEPRLSDFVSNSPAMHGLMYLVERVVEHDTPLLFQGETGVGKERLALAIHAEGPRSTGPFIPVHCGALPESLLESELFGHEEGAFTGASRARRGWFELAHRGTIFLDEIAEMPMHLQVKLLRVLQDHRIQRVGSEKLLQVDVRVMVATNADLAEEVERKRFRKDLFYRLGVVTLTLPPLRERREDIPELAESYINYFHSRIGRDVVGITAEALAALVAYDWPGNVRELMNVIERAVLLCDDQQITLHTLPAVIAASWGPAERAASGLQALGSGDFPGEWLKRPLGEARQEVLEQFERAYLAGLLEETGGRVGETARRAGIQPRSLFDKMKHHGLRKEAFRAKSGDARTP